MRYRIYFNRVEDAPQIWSIDEGDTSTEINVREVAIRATARGASHLDAEYPEPKAWFEVDAVLVVNNGVAYLDPVEATAEERERTKAAAKAIRDLLGWDRR